MKGRVYSFRNENNELVKFTVKDLINIDNVDYVLMCPEDDPSIIDVYKFSTVNGNEALELIEDENILKSIRETSKVM